MTVVLTTSLFNFFLLCYIVTTFEQVYLSQFVGLISELVANFTAGLFLYKLGTKTTLTVFYTITILGSILMLFYGLQHTDSLAFPAIFFLCRLGAHANFVVVIASNARIFHVESAATAFGFSSFFTRLISSAVPIVAIMPQPTPMIIFAVNALVGILVTILLKVHPDTEKL